MNQHTKSLQVFESCSPAKTQNKHKHIHIKPPYKFNTNLITLNASYRETRIPRDCRYTQEQKKVANVKPDADNRFAANRYNSDFFERTEI